MAIVTKSVGLKVLILPLVLALVVMISIFFIKPAFEEMNANRKALAEGKEKLADLQAQTQKLDSLQDEFESLQDKDILTAALPAEKNVENYLGELYQRASRSGISLSSFTSAEKTNAAGASYVCGSVLDASAVSPDVSSESGTAAGALSEDNSVTPVVAPPSASACVRGLTVQISAIGTWEQFLSFYKYLADSNRIANISEVSITSQKGSSEKSAVDLLGSQISLDIYYKPKSGTSSASTIAALSSGAGFDRNVLKKLEEVVYAPYEEPVVSEAGERNFFK